MARRRGRVWRVIRNSPGIQIAIYFLAFSLLVGLNTYLFYSYYPLLENKPLQWSEALMFVVESMTTVGYGWLLPFRNEITRILAIQIMLSGVIMIFVVIPLILAPFLTSLLAPAPPRKIPHRIADHTVVMGYTELTRSVVDSLTISDHDIVIIEEEKAKALEIATHYRRRAYVIWGEYTDPGTWAAACLDTARYVVICRDERETASILLGIRGQVSGKIISIVDKLSFERYLRYAGADYVLSPKHETGQILARHAVTNPAADAGQGNGGLSRNAADPERALRLVSIPVASGCNASLRKLGALRLFERFGVIVPFCWKSGKFIMSPGDEMVIDTMTSLFLFGEGGAIAAVLKEEFNTEACEGALAVIAGFGDVGAGAYQELTAAGVFCMVVDSRRHEVNQVIGNAEDEEVLKRARIGEARFCIVALNDDDLNIFTSLMARNLNPSIRLLARANHPASVDKLYRAGADYVALLPMIGGQAIARIILGAAVTILLDLPDGGKVIQKRITRADPRTVGYYVRKSGARIIGIAGPARHIVKPGPGLGLATGEDVIAIGSSEQLKKFIRLV